MTLLGDPTLIEGSRTLRGHMLDAVSEPVDIIEFATRRDAPRVSIIIPTYNRRDLVLETLSALAAQTAEDFEVIVADDASTDGSCDAVVRHANEMGLSGRVVRRGTNGGPARARNAALLQARGDVIAFTDSDCRPAPGWISYGLVALDRGARVVQGQTVPPPGASVPFFSHFIEIRRLDGTFATCNAFFYRGDVFEAGGFDEGCDYWEDLDLGWRVMRLGAKATYEPEALVYHMVMRQSASEWLRRPLLLANWTRAVARYPEIRKQLCARYWLNPGHASLTAGVMGLFVAPVFPPAALLAGPYIVGFVRGHGFSGRWPVVKAALHVWWDVCSLGTLVAASVKYRTLVL